MLGFFFPQKRVLYWKGCIVFPDMAEKIKKTEQDNKAERGKNKYIFLRLSLNKKFFSNKIFIINNVIAINIILFIFNEKSVKPYLE